MNDNLSELDSLLRALRAAGLGIGVAEELKVKHVVSIATKADADALRLLVRCVVVSSVAEGQTFDRMWEAWWEQHEARLRLEVTLVERLPDEDVVDIQIKPLRIVEHGPSSAKPGELPKRRRYVGITAIGIAVVVVGVGVTIAQLGMRPQGVLTAQSGVEKAFRLPDPEPIDGIKSCFGVDEQVVPVFLVTPPSLTPYYAGGGASTAMLVMALSLWLIYWRRTLLPKVLPAPTMPGPVDVPFGPMKRMGPVLLDRHDEEALVWGISRFVSEDPSGKVDIRRSILATAAHGGAPILKFFRRGDFRKVWLWVDNCAAGDEPLIEMFAREVQQAVGQAGLPFARANYWGVPDRIYGDDGQALAPIEMDECGDGSAVLVLTDGRQLCHALRDVEHKRRIGALFRMLRRWPRLAIVDFADGRHGLPAFAAAYGVQSLHPEEASAFLGEGIVNRKPGTLEGSALSGDALAWAAALALSPRAVNETTALWVKDALDLQVSPWAWQAVVAQGQMVGELLTFSGQCRMQLLQWLVAADTDVGINPASWVPERSRLGRALEMWRGRYADESKTLDVESPAARTREIERFILDLWSNPTEATRALYVRAAGEFAAIIRGHLAQHRPREVSRNPAHAHLVAFPWAFSALDANTRVMLNELGLGGLEKEPVDVSRIPMPVKLAVSLVVGMSMAGLAFTGWEAYRNLWIAEPIIHANSWEEQGETNRWNVKVVHVEPRRYEVVVKGYQSEHTASTNGGTTSDEPDENEPSRWVIAESGDVVDINARNGAILRLKTGAECNGAPCPKEMVYVSRGGYWMGVPDDEPRASNDEKPRHWVTIESFCMDLTEVTVAAYRECPQCTAPTEAATEARVVFPCNWNLPDRENHPVNCVDWNQATAYCKSIGKRLPTEEEWEYAARGPDDRRYPWGSAAPAGRACWSRTVQDRTCAVGSFPKGKSYFGILDMAGNVWEWTDSYYSVRYDAQSNVGLRVVRGGDWDATTSSLLSFDRDANKSEYRFHGLGFRCAAGVKSP